MLRRGLCEVQEQPGAHSVAMRCPHCSTEVIRLAEHAKVCEGYRRAALLEFVGGDDKALDRREKDRIRQQKRRAARTAAGLCNRCGGPRPCVGCRKARKSAGGKCSKCGENERRPNHSMCQPCISEAVYNRYREEHPEAIHYQRVDFDKRVKRFGFSTMMEYFKDRQARGMSMKAMGKELGLICTRNVNVWARKHIRGL